MADLKRAGMMTYHCCFAMSYRHFVWCWTFLPVELLMEQLEPVALVILWKMLPLPPFARAWLVLNVALMDSNTAVRFQQDLTPPPGVPIRGTLMCAADHKGFCCPPISSHTHTHVVVDVQEGLTWRDDFKQARQFPRVSNRCFALAHKKCEDSRGKLEEPYRIYSLYARRRTQPLWIEETILAPRENLTVLVRSLCLLSFAMDVKNLMKINWNKTAFFEKQLPVRINTSTVTPSARVPVNPSFRWFLFLCVVDVDHCLVRRCYTAWLEELAGADAKSVDEDAWYAARTPLSNCTFEDATRVFARSNCCNLTWNYCGGSGGRSSSSSLIQFGSAMFESKSSLSSLGNNGSPWPGNQFTQVWAVSAATLRLSQLAGTTPPRVIDQCLNHL